MATLALAPWGWRAEQGVKAVNFNYYLDPITKHYADFQGVMGREPFWMFVLFNFIIGLVLGLVLGIIHLYPLSYIYSLALLLPSLSAGVRRLHDTGKSGWWVLVALIPLVGWIYLIYLYCQPTTAPYAAAA
ncbi:MAG: DUF805 domain-containing protein [Gemmatimonadales bacterium]